MLRNALREELTALLTAPPDSRAPVIRRSHEQAWIYASDLPGLYDGKIPDEIFEGLKSAGWEYAPDGSWLQMRKASPEPPEGWHTEAFGPEASCCLSLLDRHRVSGDEPAEGLQRMLIKAGEEGEKACEDACRRIHHEWAERLRQGRPIPAISRAYFGG